MTIAVLPLASEPAFLWWVAPLVTFAAVCVALANSVAALRRQDRALNDNRRLRIADDVREALAEALSGLHRLHRALDRARNVVGFTRDSSRLMDALSSHGATPQSIEATNRRLDDLDRQGTAILHECEDAFAEIELRAEHVRLLLGGSHSLYLEVFCPALVSLGGIPSLEIWELPYNDPGDAAAKSALKQLDEQLARVRFAIDDLSSAGHAYVLEQQELGSRS